MSNVLTCIIVDIRSDVYKVFNINQTCCVCVISSRLSFEILLVLWAGIKKSSNLFALNQNISFKVNYNVTQIRSTIGTLFYCKLSKTINLFKCYLKYISQTTKLLWFEPWSFLLVNLLKIYPWCIFEYYANFVNIEEWSVILGGISHITKLTLQYAGILDVLNQWA